MFEPPASPFALLHTADQWLRSAHDNTALLVEQGSVQLAWQHEARLDATPGTIPATAGLVFDAWCRLYHALPEQGQVEKILLNTEDEGEIATALFEEPPLQLGEFSVGSTGAQPGPLLAPAGLAVDDDGRLFIAETGLQRVLVFDLVDKRLLRVLNLPAPMTYLSSNASVVFGILQSTPAQLVRFTARGTPRYISLPDTLSDPSGLAVIARDALLLLDGRGTAEARIVPVTLANDDVTLGVSIDVPYATALAWLSPDTLVVARQPGEDFLRFQYVAGLWSELPYLRARGYDGRGIAVTPAGKIGYWSTQGFQLAALARVRYETRGRVTSFRLDSGVFQTTWGRVLIDACMPRGTQIKVHCVALDDFPEDSGPIPRTLPSNMISVTLHRPDLSPPMPPISAVTEIDEWQILHRRVGGRELPWLRHTESADGSINSYATYEAPVIAAPGRYLWLVIELAGTRQTTPKIRSVRVEHNSHTLMRRLPRLYSQSAVNADFLRRYLAVMESDLRDFDVRAGHRHALLHPAATPQEMLPWLASLMGMTLDQRWPEAARRRITAEAIWLFRFRGTVPGLKRFMELYLERQVLIVEHFKLRGLGGALVGKEAGSGEDSLISNSILGAGFRVGGAIGEEDAVSVNEVSVKDAFATHAHRFTVIVPISLSSEQRAVLEHLLDVHRPAHTLFTLCTLDAGMRVGHGLHAGLSSLVGRSADFGQLRIGNSQWGREDLVGRAVPGTSVGSARVGRDAQVG